MIVERTSKEVIIRLPSTVDIEDLQQFLNYARYKELTAGFTISENEVDALAAEINAEYWTKNKNKLTK